MTWRPHCGANILPSGICKFRVWAPSQKNVSVRLGDRFGIIHPMRPEGKGYFAAEIAGVAPGTDYMFVLDSADRPDPASRWQPKGVHGPSRILDPESWIWTDRHWTGRPLEQYVFYEAHIGTFTPEGTFEAAISKLPGLARMGITALELMPVAEFPGRRNWGYDGVNLYAPHSKYGGPHGLKALADACHDHGIALVLDVVYNHLGPEGNYLSAFGPYFTNAHRTPWGPAVNFSGRGSAAVRRFFLDNALYWLTEYHIDALRLDAVHAIHDSRAKHILAALSEAFHARAAALGRQAFLIAENETQERRTVLPRRSGGHGIDAQWNDPFHHSLSTVLTGPMPGYLSRYGTLARLASAIQPDDEDGSPPLPGRSLVGFIQNHDQIANAFGGQRLSVTAGLEGQKLAAAILLCSPCLPLLFMGQEYGETAPFHYFTSHADSALAAAVIAGRRKEFAAFHDLSAFRNPQDTATFAESKLVWERAAREPYASIQRLYSDLIALRAAVPALSNLRAGLARTRFDERRRWLTISRGDPGGTAAILACNFSPRPVSVLLGASGRHTPWRLRLCTASPRYGGSVLTGPPVERSRVLLPPSSAAIFTRTPLLVS